MPVTDPKSVKPKRDWAFVKCDPRKEVVGGIYLPANEVGLEKVMERAGEVITVGPGEKAGALGLRPGDRIVFRGFLKYANPVEIGDGFDYFLMSIDDILGITEGQVEVGAFSRPAMHSVESVGADGSVTMRS